MTFKIEKNIPMSESFGMGNTKYPFGKMQVGDSFAFTAEHQKVGSAACAYGRIHNMRFSVRKVSEGYRCWRVK